MPGDLHIGTLHQVAQRATDLDRSIAFYGDLLGLPFIAKFDPPGLAFFDLGNTRLLLENGDHSAVLYLSVPDIEASYATLGERGLQFEGVPHLVHRDDSGTFGEPGTEEWMAFFRDPDDNIVALVERRSGERSAEERSV